MSGICAFFGHRDTPYSVDLENKVEQTAEKLINFGFNEFWVCEQGTFDWISRMVMIRLKKRYPYIYLCYVTPYNPSKYPKQRQKFLTERYEVIYPPTAAVGPKQFAITRRNKYIAENANAVICYITHKCGGAYNAVKTAQKKGADIINLACTLSDNFSNCVQRSP